MTAFADDDVLAEVTRQTDLLLETMRDLTDDDVGAPSRCPGWTRGHVLTHVARNADGLIRLLFGAAVGEQWPMYRDSPSREEEIEAGSRRGMAELEADVEASAERLLSACADYPDDALDNLCRLRSGREFPAREVGWIRWTEVVLHHLDLAAGFEMADAGPLVPRCLAEAIDRLQAKPDAPALNIAASDVDQTWQVGAADANTPTVSGSAADLAAWLTGRGDGVGLNRVPAATPLPSLPPWG